MAQQCSSLEEAEQVANQFPIDQGLRAAVEIRTEQGDLQFWAVRNSHDLDAIPGMVKCLRII